MSWWQYTILGAGGGALAEALALFNWITVWQASRRAASGRLKKAPPHWRQYIDVPAHAWMLLYRALLGAGAAALFTVTGQISGAYAAVTLGFAAPAILTRLGSTPAVARAASGSRSHHRAMDEPQPDRSPRLWDTPPAEEGGAA